MYPVLFDEDTLQQQAGHVDVRALRLGSTAGAAFCPGSVVHAPCAHLAVHSRADGRVVPFDGGFRELCCQQDGHAADRIRKLRFQLSLGGPVLEPARRSGWMGYLRGGEHGQAGLFVEYFKQFPAAGVDRARDCQDVKMAVEEAALKVDSLCGAELVAAIAPDARLVIDGRLGGGKRVDGWFGARGAAMMAPSASDALCRIDLRARDNLPAEPLEHELRQRQDAHVARGGFD